MMRIELTVDGDTTEEDVREALSGLGADVTVQSASDLDDEKREQIRSTAIDVVYEDLQAGHYDMLPLAEQLVDAESVEGQLELISPEPERRREILGFELDGGEE